MARRLYGPPGEGDEMSVAPIDAIRILAELAEHHPERVIGGVTATWPAAIVFGRELDALCNKYARLGLGRTAVIVTLAAAAGYAAGDGIDQDKSTSGEAAELITDVACSALRYAADSGYLSRAKERKNARG